MRTVAWLRNELGHFPDDALCRAYEGEDTGIVISRERGGTQGMIFVSEGNDTKPSELLPEIPPPKWERKGPIGRPGPVVTDPYKEERKLTAGKFYWVLPEVDCHPDHPDYGWLSTWQPARFDGFSNGVPHWRHLDLDGPSDVPVRGIGDEIIDTSPSGIALLSRMQAKENAEARAREIFEREAFDPAWSISESGATLEGTYKADELEAIAWWMRNKGATK